MISVLGNASAPMNGTSPRRPTKDLTLNVSGGRAVECHRLQGVNAIRVAALTGGAAPANGLKPDSTRKLVSWASRRPSMSPSS